MFLLFLVLLLTACSGPEAKKQKFLGKGKAFYAKGDYVRARLELKNALQIDPKYASAHYLLGMTALRLGDLRGAFDELRRAAELDPHNLDAQVQLGKLLLMQGAIDKAQEKATLALKAQPRHEEGLLLQAAIYISSKATPKAVALLTETIKGGMTRPDSFLLLAAAYRATHNDVAVEKTLLQGVAANSKSLGLHRALADLYAGQARPDAAAEQILRMIALEPANYSYSVALARLYWNTKQEPRARLLLDKLLAANPTREECLIDVAGFYLTHAKPDDAEQVLTKGIAANPKNFPLRFALCRLYLASRRTDKGLQLLQECLKLEKDQANPNILLTKNTLAAIYLAKGNPAAAEKLVDQVMKESSHNLEANLIKGRIHMQKGEGSKAVADFRTIVSDKPDQAGGYLLLADAHLLNRDPELALDSLHQAQKLAPTAPEVLRALARSYAFKRDFGTAERYLRELLAKDPHDGVATLLLGQVYLQRGEPKKARQMLEEMLAKEPGSWGAANDLACLLSDYGNGGNDLQKALRLARQIHARSPDNPLSQDTLGWVYYRMGDYRKSVELMEKAVARMPDNAVVRYHAGMAFYHTGRLEQAKVHLQVAIRTGEIFPGKVEAAETLKRL